MKSCATCNRTFEDSFTFCLIDGSVLSAPFDLQATKQIPVARITKAPRTEVLPSHKEVNQENLVPTVPSPLLPLQPTQPYVPVGYSPPNNAPVSVKKLSSGEDARGWIISGLILGITLGIIIGVSTGDPKNAIPLALAVGLLGAIIGKVLTRIIKRDSERVNK